MVSTWFLRSILLDKDNVKEIYEIHAIECSSESKGRDFVNKFDNYKVPNNLLDHIMKFMRVTT